MAIKLNSVSVTVPLVWQDDPAVDRASSDIVAYIKDPAGVATHVKHDGATLFHCRPISQVEHLRLLDRLAVCGYESAEARFNFQCIEAFRLGLVRVENLGPSLDGQAGDAVVEALPFKVAADLGLRVLTLSAARNRIPVAETAFSRLEALREDVAALLEHLPDSAVPEAAQGPLAAVRERMALPVSEPLHPAEEEVEDLPK